MRRNTLASLPARRDPTTAAGEEKFSEEYKLGPKGLELLRKKLGKLSITAEKLGLPPIKIEVLGTVIEKDHDPDRKTLWEKTHIRVTGSRPIMGGKRLVGVIQHGEKINVLRALPGEKLSEKYRYVPPQCDHCQTSRRRVDTVIVKDVRTGRYNQIGKNCLRDYLGHDDPHTAAKWLEDISNSLETAKDTPEEEGSGGGGGSSRVETDEWMEHVAAMVRLNGWRSAAAAQASRLDSTRMQAAQNLFPPPKHVPALTTAADKRLGKRAVQWVRDQPVEWANNDYLRNVKAIADKKYLESRDLGLMASIVPLYQREHGLMEKRKKFVKKETEPAKVSEHQGEVGERISRRVTVTFTQPFETDWGTSVLIAMEDADGNRYKWFASDAMPPEKGLVIDIEGTVKAHGEWQGTKDTMLTRAKIYPTREMVEEYYKAKARYPAVNKKAKANPGGPDTDKAVALWGKMQSLAPYWNANYYDYGGNNDDAAEKDAILAKLDKREADNAKKAGKPIIKKSLFLVRLANGRTLLKAVKRPAVGQGSLFDAGDHPRAPVGGQGKYEGGEFVPKAASETVKYKAGQPVRWRDKKNNEKTGILQRIEGNKAHLAGHGAIRADDLLGPSKHAPGRNAFSSYGGAVEANYAYMKTPAQEWSATPIKGWAEVEAGKGEKMPMPEFDLPSGYKEAPSLFKMLGGVSDMNCELCCAKISNVYYCQNNKRKLLMRIGSECFKHFGEQTGEELVKESRYDLNRKYLARAIDTKKLISDLFSSRVHVGYGRYNTFIANREAAKISTDLSKLTMGLNVGGTYPTEDGQITRWINRDGDRVKELLERADTFFKENRGKLEGAAENPRAVEALKRLDIEKPEGAEFVQTRKIERKLTKQEQAALETKERGIRIATEAATSPEFFTRMKMDLEQKLIMASIPHAGVVDRTVVVFKGDGWAAAGLPYMAGGNWTFHQGQRVVRMSEGHISPGNLTPEQAEAIASGLENQPNTHVVVVKSNEELQTTLKANMEPDPVNRGWRWRGGEVRKSLFLVPLRSRSGRTRLVPFVV